MSNQTIPETYWRTLLYMALWPLWLALWVPMAIVGLVGVETVSYPIRAIAFAPVLVFGVGTVIAHIGLIVDGRKIKSSDVESWRPWWIAYFLASLLVGVFLIAPLYVIRRRWKTGRPNRDDLKRKLSLRGLFVPWH